MEHFKSSSDTSPSIINMIAFMFLSILTLGFSFFFLYEMFLEPHYWKNRWKLHRLFKVGKVDVKIDRLIHGQHIQMYILKIDEIEYSLWIYDDNSITLDSINSHTDYIGLFKASVITKWLNHIAIKEIVRLSGESEKSKEEPRFETVDDFTADDYRNC